MSVLLKSDQASIDRGHCDYTFHCPGCKCSHGVWITKRNGLGATWTFNGNEDKPTFRPSLLVRHTQVPPVDPRTNDFARGEDGKYLVGSDGKLLGCKEVVCHSFITDGQIQFLGDCTHELAGKTVAMEQV